MIRRLLPSPPLSALLFVVWLLLNQSLSPGALLMAAILAIAVPLITRSLRPAQVQLHRPWVATKLFAIVVRDLTRSNFAVGRLVLTRKAADIPSGFIVVPLDLRDPNGLAMLAMVLCLTPGTAWAEVALDRSALLVHVFEIRDKAGMIAMIKQRYERPLMEIFE